MISIAYDAEADVFFKDTLNNSIDCNYVSVDCRSQGAYDSGFFVVQPSGVYSSEASTIEYVNNASAAGDHSNSGIGGVVGTADGSVEMSLASKDRTGGVRIWNKLLDTTASQSEGTTNPAWFIVTYGNMKQANRGRDQDEGIHPEGS